ncbi:MAG: hypothetical protein L6Q34_00355 [Nitrospira sp.]|nr:hypothetical protein [Nitrospira sp.]MEB2339986.1 hypothetical protein [Nitrospirales bacterium]QOJ35745.1 MAG: hypothetical protein HRU82_12695 [Nitrospira sp.]
MDCGEWIDLPLMLRLLVLSEEMSDGFRERGKFSRLKMECDRIVAEV